MKIKNNKEFGIVGKTITLSISELIALATEVSNLEGIDIDQAFLDIACEEHEKEEMIMKGNQALISIHNIRTFLRKIVGDVQGINDAFEELFGGEYKEHLTHDEVDRIIETSSDTDFTDRTVDI